MIKPYTVKFQVHEIIDVPAESEEEAREKAWEWVKDHGYLDAEVIEQSGPMEPDWEKQV